MCMFNNNNESAKTKVRNAIIVDYLLKRLLCVQEWVRLL